MAPSIKGVLLTKLVDDVRALLERSEADRERLEVVFYYDYEGVFGPRG